MKNICFVCNTLSIGGSEKQSVLLARELNREFSVNFAILKADKIVNQYNDMLEQAKISKVRTHRTIMGSVLSLYLHFVKHEVDYIVSYLFLSNIVAALLKIMFPKVKMVMNVRSSRLSPIKMLVQRIIHNKLSSATIVNSSSGYNYLLENGFNKDKIKTIHNLIEDQNYVNSQVQFEQSGENFIRILSVGRLEHVKDFYTAISSIKLLLRLRKDSKIKYVIVGYGSQKKEIQNWISSNGLDGVVSIQSDPPDPLPFFRISDIFLQTSLYEGFSNSILEALSFGLPIVATNVGDNALLIENGYNGFLTDVKNPSAIAEKLDILVSDNSLRTTMRVNSKVIFRKLKSADPIAQYIKVLNDA